MMEHTPLKSDLSIVRDSKGTVLACCAGKEVAAEIVQAVNSHEALAEACKLLIKSYGRDKYDPAVVAARAALKLAGVKP